MQRALIIMKMIRKTRQPKRCNWETLLQIPVDRSVFVEDGIVLLIVAYEEKSEHSEDDGCPGGDHNEDAEDVSGKI